MSRPTQYGTPGAQRTTGTAFAPRSSPYTRTGSSLSSNPRSIQRDKWSRKFGGGAYLDPGPSNRLVLSLKSQIGVELDFALERLVPVSSSDPDLLRFSDLPGLLDSLFAVIQSFLDLRGRSAPQFASFSHEFWQTGAREASRRRATEAALVLRNLALEKRSLEHLFAYRRLLGVVVGVLAERDMDGPEGEGCTEMSVYLLEVLELVAGKIQLALPGRAPTGKKAHAEAKGGPPSKLFPQLVALTRTTDRALVVLGLRCLTVLSTNERNDGVLAYSIYISSPPQPKPHPHPIETAIELLPLADGELSIAALDFIYQHTLVPANSAAFCSRPELLAVLRLVCSKLHLGAKRETLDVVVPVKGSEADLVARAAPLRHPRIGAARDSPTVLDSKLEPEKQRELIPVPEPERAQRWMRYVFEAEPDSEVTQVVLWTAYRTEFEGKSVENPIKPAADIIKMASEVFPNAAPMVTELPDRRFIIKGIRLRDRTDFRATFMCRWLGCPTTVGPTSAGELYSHIHHNHIAQIPPPANCCWSTCTYAPDASLDPSVQVKELSLHVKTHMPVYHPPTGYPYPNSGKINSHGMGPPLELLKVRHARYHADLDEHGEPTGLGLLSCLVLRNVARTVQRSLGVITANASVQALAEGDSSIFEEFAAAADGATKRDAVQGALEKVDLDKVAPAREALLGLEETLVQTSLEDFGLGKMLGEVLGVVTECRESQKK